MRIMAIGAFGALLLTASLALGQASQPTLPSGVSRTVHSAAIVSVRVPDLKIQPPFTAGTTMGTASEIVLTRVVAQINGAQYTADRAVIRPKEGEIRFEGNVRVISPAPK